jgi:hypothetical protein
MPDPDAIFEAGGYAVCIVRSARAREYMDAIRPHDPGIIGHDDGRYTAIYCTPDGLAAAKAAPTWPRP